MLLAFAMAAPPAGPPPYFLELKADDRDRVMVLAFRTELKKVVRFNIEKDQNGESVFREEEVIEPRVRRVVVEITELKDLKACTAAGQPLTHKELLVRLGRGSVVIVSANGEPVDAAYLRLFRDDAIVLCSPELVPKGGD